MVKKPKSPPSGGEGKLTGGSHVSEGFPSECELIVSLPRLTWDCEQNRQQKSVLPLL